MYRSLLACLYACFIVVFVAGCGGGSGDQAGATATSPSAENFVDIAAVPGPITAVRVGQVVVLDDRNSYARSDEPMSYSWSFSYKPYGSNAVLQDVTSSTPSFTADVRGVYMVQLVVSAEGVSSQRAVTSVIATVPPERMTGPFNHPGLSSNCVNCHNDENATLRGKSQDHIASSNMCQSCHTPQGFHIIPFADHQEVFGNCSQCHNGVQAIGKSEFHQPTDAECDSCHNTISFVELQPDGSFDHSNIRTVCAGCHNGIVATGKHEAHVVTDAQCGYCHTTDSFLPAYPDHTGPVVTSTTCDSCHVADGSGSASGQSLGHPLTNVDCDACHSIVSFKMPGGLFNHSLVNPTVQSCESCHNDSTSINAPAKSSAVPAHPVTTADCGACHNTESFSPAFGFNHDGVVDNCQTCHGNNNPVSPQVTATGKPLATPFYAHMPTNPDNPGTASDQDCGDCHTTGTFSSGTYDHAGVFSGCTSCHDNRISVGKLPNHIPTNPASQDCVDCHNTTTFAGVIFDHTGINTSNCAQCHDGDIALGKSLNHLPTILDCSSCHDTFNYTTFAGITFNHLGIDNNDCASCHATGIATPKIVNHIPAREECSDCHDSTAVFASTTFLLGVHAGITRGCEGCHDVQFLSARPELLKSAGHIPTTQDCDSCHTVAGFTPSNFAHMGITGNCESCHNGSFVNVGLNGARAAPNTPIHQNTSSDCAVCHNTSNFADAFVDHNSPEVRAARCDSCHNGVDATGKDAKVNPPHVPTTQDCDVCHVAGGTFVPAVFDHTGITNNCESCHDGTAATGKTQNHLPTTQDCSACHITTDFANARFDHTGITDNCASCHNGTTARGKVPPPDHVPTNQDCNACHVTTGFIPGTFDHTGIVDNCRSCHNNAFAIGKSASHVATNQDCGVCHNTSTFTGAVFDHTGIVDNCTSCHGVTATGKNNGHIDTSLDCHFCHTTATFVGGTWFHDASTVGRCDDCHSPNGGATSKPNGHISTNVQCDVCHSTDRWAPDIFRHSSAGDYPGDHRVNPSCADCHGSNINSTFSWPASRYAPFCAACHERDFRSTGDHIGGRSGTVEQNKNCGRSGCHSIRDRNWD